MPELVEITLLSKHGSFKKGSEIVVDVARAEALVGAEVATYGKKKKKIKANQINVSQLRVMDEEE